MTDPEGDPFRYLYLLGRKNLGRFAKEARLRAGYSLRRLANLSGVSESNVRRVEAGKECTMGVFIRLCYHLGLPSGRVLDTLASLIEPPLEKSLGTSRELARVKEALGAYSEAESAFVGRFVFTAASFVVFLTVCSSAARAASLTEYPTEAIRSAFLRFAFRIECAKSNLERIAIIRDIEHDVAGALTCHELLSVKLIRPYLEQFRRFLKTIPERADSHKALGDFSVWHPHRVDLDDLGIGQSSLDKYIESHNVPGMPLSRTLYWDSLRNRLRSLTEARGIKARLAKDFGVTRQAVQGWVSGTSVPTAEAALRLLHWVEGGERGKRPLGSVATTTEGKLTRKRRDKHGDQTTQS